MSDLTQIEGLQRENDVLKAQLAAAERERDEAREKMIGFREFSKQWQDRMESAESRLSAAVKALETVRRWMGDPLAAHLPMKDIHSNREILGIIDAALKEARP